MQVIKYKILIAEDDLHLGILLVDFLEQEGYEVKLCKDGEWALSVFESHKFDLCLLDVMMPKLDGFALATAIRKYNQEIPILFITAKSLKEDKLKGYGVGADDYIIKPFDEEELLCKIKAFTKRLPQKNNTLIAVQNIGQYIFDYQNQSLSINNVTKRLTEKERDILQYLVSHKNIVIKRKDVLLALWGQDDYFLGRSLDVFITKIRKYLKDDATIYIENVFAVGWVFHVG